MDEVDNIKGVIFPVSVLYIQIDTNTGTNGESVIQLFKRSMIKMPKMDTPPLLTSEYPFFTKNVRYPKSMENQDWKSKYEFFFNRELFMDRLRKEIDENPISYKEKLTSNDESESQELYEWMKKTEMHNIMVTLRALFPIPELFGKVLKNSYKHILRNGINTRISNDIDIRNVANIFGFMYKFGIMNKEKEEYFINIGGKRYEVDDVIWENDVVNHPIYKQFLNSQRSTYEEVEKSAPEVEEKYMIYMKKLDNDLKEMSSKERFQRDFFIFSGKCADDAECKDDNKLFEFFKKNIKNANKDEIEKTYVLSGGKNIYTPLFQYLTHKHFFTKYYNEWNDMVLIGDEHKHDLDNMNTLKTNYDEMQNLNIKNNSDLSSKTEEIHKKFDEEIHAIFLLEHDDPTESEFEKNTVNEYVNYLKSDTLFMLRMHILSKIATSQQTNTPYQNSNADRKNTVATITDKLKRLSNQTGDSAVSNQTGDSAVETIISIKEDLDNHQQLHRNEGISVFMERDYEAIFERLLKSAIEIKAASIVLKFAKNNIPMNLTGKKLDGTDVSPVNQRINKYIGEFFGTEASINNQLSTNVNNVYEPVRKTSNKELYKVLKLFKLGDVIMKKEHKMSTSEIDEYREVLEKIHDQYISNRRKKTNDLDEYLYTGVDEVKSTSGSGEDKKTENEIRRNVHEIYVRLDLIDADMYEKSDKAACKLLDKELEQEYMYLVDPHNKNNSLLSRFRNMNFAAVPEASTKTQETKKTAPPSDLPDKLSGGKHNKSARRVRLPNRSKTARRSR